MEVVEDVSILQNGFVTLTDEVDDVESVNILQDDRLNIMESDISDNENDIEGNMTLQTIIASSCFDFPARSSGTCHGLEKISDKNAILN